MSDLELLFLVLAIVYGWECACWLPRGSVAFLTWLGRRWHPTHPGAILGNQRGGFVLASPLPPLGSLLTGTQFPISLSPDAVLAHVAQSVNPGWRPAQSAELFRFEDIRTIDVRGKKVRVNGEILIKAVSTTFAEHLAEQLCRLQQAALEKRGRMIQDMFRASLDIKAIEQRGSEYQKLAAPLRLLTNLIFGYLFLLAPILIWNFGLSRCWLGLVIGLLGLTTTTAIRFHRAHKILYPSAEDERFTHFLTILLSPATSIRAHDALSRPLLETFHPLAIAKVFCPPQVFREFAGKILREIRHPGLPLCPRVEPAALGAERFSRETLLKATEDFLKRGGLDVEELMRPPLPADRTSRAYCPRCLAQFTSQEGACIDCGGLALLELAGLGLQSQSTNSKMSC